MNFTESEIRILLKALRTEYGMGYSDNPEVAKLQARLSMMLEMAITRESCQRVIQNDRR